MDSTRRLWTLLAVLLVGSFSVLLWTGSEIYQQAPPMPERVVASDGSLVYSRSEIEQGRTVWQSMGGMQLGSIWGHGGYVAPDWTADWLHREAKAMRVLVWLRVPGDTVFSVGAVALAWFVISLWIRPRYEGEQVGEQASDEATGAARY